MAETIRMQGGGAAAPGAAHVDSNAETPRRGSLEPGAAKARRCEVCQQVFSGQARFCPIDGERLVDAPEWAPHEDPLLGKTVDGRYKVLEVLGEGETGKVYKVQHAALGRRFALKVLRRDFARDPDMVARFIREAQAAAAIGHPNIIAVSDFGELPARGPGEPALPYFVMEYLEGMSLAGLLAIEGPLSPARAGAIFSQVASALSAAHAAGVIHRNLKPANIFITRTGERDFIKILDFGVAKIVGTGRLTKVGMISGTPHYMSPEQASGQPVDLRVDIYALGVILFESFTGRVPFDADTYAEVLRMHVNEPAPPIEESMPRAGELGAFGPITMRCLAKGPKERYLSMAELASAIEAASPRPPPSSTGSRRGKAAKHRRKDRSIGRVAAIAAGLGTVLGLLLWAAMRNGPPAAVPTASSAAPSNGSAALPASATPPAAPPASVVAPTASAAASAVPLEASTSTTTPTPPSASAIASAPTAPPVVRPPTTKTGSLSTKRPPPTPSGIVDPWAKPQR